MESPSTAGRWTLNRIVALVLAAGFIFLLVETRIEHDRLLAREPLSFIPFVFSLPAFLVALAAAVRWKPGLVKSLLGVSLLSIAVGCGGLWFHNEDRIEGRGGNAPPPGEARAPAPESGERSEQRPPQEQRVQGEQPPGREQPAGDRQQLGPERRPRRRGPPMLAPAAFLGMGLLGTLITLRRWPADVA